MFYGVLRQTQKLYIDYLILRREDEGEAFSKILSQENSSAGSLHCTKLWHKALFKNLWVAFKLSFCFQAIDILKAFFDSPLLPWSKLVIAGWLNPNRYPNFSHFPPSSRDSPTDSSSDGPPALICLSRVWLQTEPDDTKCYDQLIIKFTISEKRRIAKLWKKATFCITRITKKA